MARIVIDPGHGGWQTIPNDSTWNNAVGPNGTLEKNLTLQIGRLTREALLAGGHEVRMTRDADVNLRLRERARVAHAMNAHVFVSIHLNGSERHNAQGTETLVHLDYSPLSARLSLDVQDAVLAVTGLTDRNRTFNPSTRIKPQALGVLKPAYHRPTTAACLVEISFLDRADEEVRLQGDGYRKDIANAIAKGIGDYARMIAAPAHAIAPGPDFGDAIEVMAKPKGTKAKVAVFLDLVTPARPAGRSPVDETIDRNERSATPPKPFSPAFVEGGGADMALIAGDAWDLLDEFNDFFAKLGLKHFAADELLVKGASNQGGGCKGRNTFPPKELWNNIANTAMMLDLIRAELGAPIRILSGYRSPAYNGCIGGERGSQHMRFNAIDFTCGAGTPEIWRRVAGEIRKSERRFAGGIGVYPRGRFVHIDTRGSEANWQGR